MSKGSEEKEHPYDQQCPHCNLWYRKRGIESHKANCDEKDSSNETKEADTEVAEETDIMPEEKEPEETEETEESDNQESWEDEAICPSCGNVDNEESPHIYYSDSILNAHKDDLAKEDIKLLTEKELFCGDCHSAFNV
jgi:hypothetical protein